MRILLLLLCVCLVGCGEDSTPYEHCVDFTYYAPSHIEGACNEYAVASYLERKYDLECEVNENCFSVKVLLPLDKYAARILPIVVEKTREELKDTPIIIEVETLEEALNKERAEMTKFNMGKNEKMDKLKELYRDNRRN